MKLRWARYNEREVTYQRSVAVRVYSLLMTYPATLHYFFRQLYSKAVDVSTYLILDGTKSGAANRTIGAAIDPAGNVV